jgi:hypothetical protein
MPEVLGRRTENQHGHPVVGSIPGEVVKAFAHRTKTAQVMMLIEPLVDPGCLGARGQVNADLV